MALRTILIHPDPRLKKVCAPVDGVDRSVRKLADDMLETMHDAPGIGLAAPQVGILQRLIVMDCAKKDEEPQPMALINPEVTWVSEELNTYSEGCLSIPEQYEDVTRPAEVRVRWLDLDGKPQEQKFDGLWATCVQHEIDHLNGKLFIDYLSRIKRSMITKKMIKLKKERAAVL
ncbi:MAG: peptide deformylase [Paracoccaceae bacterium]|nr:peptide deformylase [Paracoccaceae bacterium]